MLTTIKITVPRGLHLRPSQILERKILEIKEEVYFIKDSLRKRIKNFNDILSLEIAQGETIGIQVYPNSKKSIDKIKNTIIEINSITFS